VKVVALPDSVRDCAALVVACDTAVGAAAQQVDENTDKNTDETPARASRRDE
jgi:hypothetical protein